MKSKFKSTLKWFYYTLRSKLGEALLPKKYRYEYTFFEKLRRGSYSDLAFEEAKLRSKAHQIDKTLVFDKTSKRDILLQQVTDLINKIGKSPEHDTATIRWANKVLSEYRSRLAGKPASKEGFKRFDHKGQALLAEVIQNRRTIRSFKPDVIDGDILKKVLQAGLWAPTGCNLQTIEYLVLKTKDDIKFCQHLAGEGYPFPTEAPLSIVVLVDPRNYALPSQRHMAFLETGAAVQNVILTAYSYGIGSCWLFWSDINNRHAEFIKRFILKPWLLPVAMVCLGYPDNCPKFAPERKHLERCTHSSYAHCLIRKNYTISAHYDRLMFWLREHGVLSHL